MSQIENIKQLIVNSKILPVALKHSAKKIAAVVAGLSIIFVYQNCSSPTPDLSQYSGSSVSPGPGPTASGLGIQITSPVGKICTIPAVAATATTPAIPGGVDVTLTATGGNANSKYVFSLLNPAPNSSVAISIGSITQAPPGFSKNDVVVYHVPPVTNDTVVTAYVYDSNVMNSAIGKISFTVGALHATLNITSSTTAGSPFVISDCAVGAAVTIESWGGGGGGGGYDAGNAGGSGGGGAYVMNVIDVIAKDDVFDIQVGGEGIAGLSNSIGVGGGLGGANGGGRGGYAGASGSSGAGGGGGGYSRVLYRKINVATGVDIVIAGGGGGGGGGANGGGVFAGGAGGVSGAGYADNTPTIYTLGGTSGSEMSFSGGNGGAYLYTLDTGGSGGGGGGYHGGAGGSILMAVNIGGPSGGGGSSYFYQFQSAKNAIINGSGVKPGGNIQTLPALINPQTKATYVPAYGGLAGISGSPGLVRISW